MRGQGPIPRARAALRATPLHRLWRMGRSAVGARREGAALDAVRTYVLFIGHARSGHSVLGALLDAHPQIAISDELDALVYVGRGFSRRQLLWLSLEISRRQGRAERRKGGLGGTTYSYHVPGGWQGRHRDLRVVGDSQAGWTVRRLARDPSLLGRLEAQLDGLSLRFVHVVRNPFDNIATMMLRGRRSFESAFDQYFTNCASIERLVPTLGADRILRLRHEQLIADPRGHLAAACRFLDLEPHDDYLDAAAAIVYPSPSRSRDRIEWPGDRVDRIRAEIERYDFLDGYRFDA